jgi:hypothetical protein
VTGAVPLGHALGDILDAFRGTHRSAAVFVNDESHLLIDASDCAKPMKLHEEWLPVKAKGVNPAKTPQILHHFLVKIIHKPK